MPRNRTNTPLALRMSKHTVIDAQSGCHIWTGAKNTKGYGRIRLSSGRAPVAHRVAYELAIGEIPDGYQLDHLCGNRACVNPEHLEAVTPAENNRRSNSPSAQNARKTHCKAGHEFTSATTGRGSKGQRYCLVCNPKNPRRTARTKPPKKPRDYRGQKNNFAKLTPDLVLEILACDKPWSRVEGGFGITKQHFYKIRSGKRWSHIANAATKEEQETSSIQSRPFGGSR